MINKYQQGGQAQQLIQQFAQDLIQNQVMSEEQLQQIAQQNPDMLQQLFQIWQQSGIEGVVQVLQQSQQQAQSAKQGAKLNYLKRLMNICPEGEELVYFKAGGKVGCGCKKKVDKDCGGSTLLKKLACGKKVKKGQDGEKISLTDYRKPKEKTEAKLPDGTKVKFRTNEGQRSGEDPITIKGQNYYLNGDSTLTKSPNNTYTHKQLRKMSKK